jgi:hypothetical protein
MVLYDVVYISLCILVIKCIKLYEDIKYEEDLIIENINKNTHENNIIIMYVYNLIIMIMIISILKSCFIK